MQLIGGMWNILDHGIMIISKDGDLLDSNTAVPTILGGTYTEFRDGFKNGRYQLFHKNGKPVTVDSHTGIQAIARDKATSGIIRIVDTETGKEKWIDMRSQPLYDDAGRVVAGLCAIVDVTDAVRFKQERIDFVSRASHELRTPVAIVDGFLSLADTYTDDIDLREMVTHARRGSAMLRWIVEGLTILSNIATDTSPLYPTPLAEIVLQAMQSVEEKAAERGLVIETAVSPGLVYTGHYDQLKRMVEELLSNAIKFSTEGTITISLSQSDECIVLTVSDEGCGIPEEQMPRIYEMGWQGNGSSTRPVDGLGIGLAIVDRVARYHNGRVEVSSRVGEGAAFTVYLPL